MQLPALNESASLRYGTFFYLYFMQGIPSGFALTTLSNYLIGKQVPPQVVGGFIAIVGLPWIIQFIWGPFIDRFQFSVMGNRKHWVVASQFMATIASLSLLLIDRPEQQIPLMSAAFFVHSIFASIQDASVDAMAISVIPKPERGRTNGFMRGGFLLGIALGAAGLSIVLHAKGFRNAALLQSLLLLGFTIITLFIKVDRADRLLPSFGPTPIPTTKLSNPNIRSLFKRLYAAITMPSNLRYFAIVATVYFAFSVFIRSFSYHLIHELHWPDKSLSVLQGSWGTAVSFIALMIGGMVADKFGPRRLQVRIMWILGIFLLVINALFFIWHIELVPTIGLIFWNIADPLFSIAAFPILMELCAEQVEGSQFTTYMALINLCDVLGSYLTGWALASLSAPLLGLCCGFIILLMLRFTPREPPLNAQSV